MVHFSCFFRFMEEAEHAFWRAAGLSIAPPGSQIGFPRVAAACDFHRPLRFEQEFDVLVRLTAITAKTFRYTFLLTSLDERIATGTMTTICVSKRPDEPSKAIPIPTEIAARFEAVAGGDA